ncbi:AMP-binding protein [Bradyrhizobium sp. RDI18]|uniref:AMP-binding protein n=1 Tax=Bradyrhizobium sp. RDI18 TaxID=3367400 RepID=UPI00371527DC
MQEFRARTGHTILERYGMTENTVITSNPFSDEGVARICASRRLIQARRRDDDLAAIDEVGELVVKGANIFKGYWNLPENGH